MSNLITYKTFLGEPVQVVTPTPAGAGGLALNGNFQALSDVIQSISQSHNQFRLAWHFLHYDDVVGLHRPYRCASECRHLPRHDGCPML